jgi:pSer/pThr/pTyr-binding forkhead associated (FHA) protein
MRLKWFSTLFILGMFIAASFRIELTSAQSSAAAYLLPPKMDDFPNITTYLDVQDASGNFIHGLKETDLKLVENNTPVSVTQFSETHPGVQFSIAFSPGHTLSIRDGLGISRFDYLISGLKAWQWDPQAAGADDLSLITLDGPELLHVSDPNTLLSALQAYQPNLRNTQPNLEALSRAIQVAEDELPRPGMERAILFITPPQPPEAESGLQNLAARASQLGIRIFVWMVAYQEASPSPEISLLQNLASQSGGTLFAFTGIETIPDIENYLEPLRHIYSLSYTSALTGAGTFPLYVEVSLPEQTITSNQQEIALDIQPPNPIFVSPPAEISRQYVDPAQAKTASQTNQSYQWTPEEQELQVLTEFPDGHTRPIVQSSLFVDGAVVQINTEPPFDQFIWDLRPYVESSSHVLQAEVQDSLGYTNRSLEIPVQISVEQPTNSFKLILSSRGLLLTGTLVVFTGAVVVLVLVLGGRIQPHQPGKPAPNSNKSARQTRSKRGLNRVNNDPVTQPVHPKAEEPTRPTAAWALRLPHSHTRTSSQVLAFLTPVPPSDEPYQAAPIPISSDEIIFGYDPTQSTWVIDDPSLDGLHARLIREGNAYRLVDAGTTAGTWINYTPVSSQGNLVENGDLIHLGRTCFRFSSRAPGKGKKPTIIAVEHSS